MIKTLDFNLWNDENPPRLWNMIKSNELNNGPLKSKSVHNFELFFVNRWTDRQHITFLAEVRVKLDDIQQMRQKDYRKPAVKLM